MVVVALHVDHLAKEMILFSGPLSGVQDVVP